MGILEYLEYQSYSFHRTKHPEVPPKDWGSIFKEYKEFEKKYKEDKKDKKNENNRSKTEFR